MKKVHLAVLASLFLTEAVQARVIYGRDNRKEVSNASNLQKASARAAATMIPSKDITRSSKAGRVNLSQTTLRDWLEMSLLSGEKDRQEKLFTPKVLEAASMGVTFCEGERFVDQPNPGLCSGFLIADDLLLTAGHCVRLDNFCSDYKWVFGFEVDPRSKKAGIDVPESDVYSCEKVLSSDLSSHFNQDYGLVKLNRKVQGRTPVDIRNEGIVDSNASLFVVGSPSGLPLKVADNAKVRSNSHPFFFSANTDTFQGNSGSAVFNEKTGVVEGILVRGEQDFQANSRKRCVETYKCKDNECRGEEITRLTAIPEIGVQAVLNRAAANGDVATVRSFLRLNIWVDFYTKNRETALIKASKTGQGKVIELLIEKGADANHQDLLGNTALHYLAKVLNKDNEDALSKMISADGDLTIKNNLGETPADIARKLNPEALKILQSI